MNKHVSEIEERGGDGRRVQKGKVQIPGWSVAAGELVSEQTRS